MINERGGAIVRIMKRAVVATVAGVLMFGGMASTALAGGADGGPLCHRVGQGPGNHSRLSGRECRGKGRQGYPWQ